MHRCHWIITGAIACVIAGTPAVAQNFDDVTIEATRVAGPIYMLTGRGGNIGLCVGDDGAFLVDDQYAPLTDKIVAAVAKITDKPVRFVVNTHWHGDHTGGNEHLGERGAVLVAHDNVRRRLSTEQFMTAFDRTVPPSPREALPVITFAESVTFHLNGQTIAVRFVGPAHTDGDSVVYFEDTNVLHTGDTFFNGMYPFIDPSSGGNIDGMVRATQRVLEMINDQTRIIPGHGPLAKKSDLKAFHDMLDAVAKQVHALHADGKFRQQIIDAKPTAPFDEKWGGGFLKPDRWVGIVCDGLGIE